MAQRSKNVITRRIRDCSLLVGCGLMATACSMVKIGYEMAPTLARWEISEYVTFDGAQQVMADQRLEHLHEWHRSTQVPGYVAWLSRAAQRLEPLARADAAGPDGQIRPALAIDADELAQWRLQAFGYVEPMFLATARPFAELALTFTAAQLDEIERALKKRNDELQSRYAVSDQRKTQDRRVERWQERLEYFLGPLTEKQQARLDRRVRALPAFTGWWESRLERQREAMVLLRQLSAEQPDLETAEREVRSMFRRWGQSRQAMARPQAGGTVHRSDQIIADMLAIATPAQFAHARKLLAGFAEDLRGVGGMAPVALLE